MAQTETRMREAAARGVATMKPLTITAKPETLPAEEQVLLDEAREALGKEGVSDADMLAYCYRVIHQTSADDPDAKRARDLRAAILERKIDEAKIIVRGIRRIPDGPDTPERRACDLVHASCGPCRPVAPPSDTPDDTDDYQRAGVLLREWEKRSEHQRAAQSLDKLLEKLR